jgi:hypothetical protein
MHDADPFEYVERPLRRYVPRSNHETAYSLEMEPAMLDPQDGTNDYDGPPRTRYPHRPHRRECRWSGMNFGEVSPDDQDCICRPAARRRRMAEPSKEQLLQAQIDEAANIAARARLELDRLQRRPAEPLDDRVVRFQYQFRLGGTIYNYAAIKAGSLWYTTGPKSPKGYTWTELLDWLAESTNAPFLSLATEFTPMGNAYPSLD